MIHIIPYGDIPHVIWVVPSMPASELIDNTHVSLDFIHLMKFRFRLRIKKCLMFTTGHICPPPPASREETVLWSLCWIMPKRSSNVIVVHHIIRLRLPKSIDSNLGFCLTHRENLWVTDTINAQCVTYWYKTWLQESANCIYNLAEIRTTLKFRNYYTFCSTLCTCPILRNLDFE